LVAHAPGGSSGARSSANRCTCFLETQATRNPGQQLGIKTSMGNSLYHREILPRLVATSSSPPDFSHRPVLSQLSNIPTSQMEQKLIRSDKPFSPSPPASTLPQSSSLPQIHHPPSQLSSGTGGALPTRKHTKTQNSLFTFRPFSTAQFQNVKSPE